ncbi:8-oxo-dGTP diphosphatase MutT [Planctobacterium marinum]|uniref:8-oxo-dGTP diphosphatase MutT n=1 Tax=Planctobacterium marinum TaxID=1631968 RepID=UPI001E545470|nr:8-oxo-dGTP diphosphatase MutT [Planctobacterium marinum]MCC2605397.1 8-oxo-dGTP diphosphatase MutT [Planctobacterium marinum]
MTKVVEVAVGVILRDEEVFLTRRASDAHQGGKWEFPGGKREAHESMTEALSRELQEEVGIEVLSASPLIQINHDYGDKTVLLDVYTVSEFANEPESKEDLEYRWVAINHLPEVDFPAANGVIVDKLLSQFDS